MSVFVNISKAKDIAHDRRRKHRQKLFEPHDEVIAKQIPGTDLEQVEAARQSIRATDDDVQAKIDAANSDVELRNILVNYGAVK